MVWHSVRNTRKDHFSAKSIFVKNVKMTQELKKYQEAICFECLGKGFVVVFKDFYPNSKLKDYKDCDWCKGEGYFDNKPATQIKYREYSDKWYKNKVGVDKDL
jgi:hypothetical protein